MVISKNADLEVLMKYTFCLYYAAKLERLNNMRTTY